MGLPTCKECDLRLKKHPSKYLIYQEQTAGKEIKCVEIKVSSKASRLRSNGMLKDQRDLGQNSLSDKGRKQLMAIETQRESGGKGNHEATLS